MADSDDEELRQPAEEHQMQRGPVEMEGVTAMLPKLKFLESCTQDTDVAKEVALMAGFKLAVGPRVAFEFYNTIDTRDLDDMVSKSADTYVYFPEEQFAQVQRTCTCGQGPGQCHHRARHFGRQQDPIAHAESFTGSDRRHIHVGRHHRGRKVFPRTFYSIRLGL